MEALDLVISVVAGLLIGFSMGTVGGGGAVLAVPVLVYGLGQTPLQATTGSLIVVGVTGIIGAIIAHEQGRLDLGQGTVFGLAAIVGSAAGAVAAHQVPGSLLMALFALVMLVVAFTMVRRLAITPRGIPAQHLHEPLWRDGHPDWPRVAKVAVLATAVGALTGFLGVGGGFMIVPALTLVLGVPMKKAAGTSLMVIAINCVAALVTRLVTAPAEVQPQWSSITVITIMAALGLGVGTAVQARANSRQLATGFAALVGVVAVYTVVRAVPTLF
ncbi:sulfite exporter TauE/SafE family protein [Propionibacteriaceae bacterium G1746]